VVLGVVFTTIFGMRPSLAIVVTLPLLPTYLAQRNLTFRSGVIMRCVCTQIIGNCLAVLVAELFRR
jgi:hypothetical protein